MNFSLTRANLHWLWPALALPLIAAGLILLPLANAVALIGGALALFALLRVPELALYAIIFAVPYGSLLPLTVGAANPTGAFSVTAVDLLVVVVLVLWIARMIAKDRAIIIRLPSLTIPFALFLFAAFVSMTGATSLQLALKEFAKFAEMFAIYLFVANDSAMPLAPPAGAGGRERKPIVIGNGITVTQLDTKLSVIPAGIPQIDNSKMTRVLIAMMLAGISQAAIGAYQFFFKIGPDGFLLFDRFIRAFGTFEQPNPYAGYLGLTIPIALGLLLGASNVVRASGEWQTPALQRTQFGASVADSNNSSTLLDTQSAVRHSPPAIRYLVSAIRYSPLALFALATLLATTAALGMSWSRGAWIGVGAGLVIAVVAQSKRAFVLSLIGAGLFAFIIWLSSISIIPNAIAARFSGVEEYFGVFDVRGVLVDDANFALVERMAHWQAAFYMFQNHPLLGVGFGNYQVVYPDYSLPRWSDPLGHAHNYYLNVAAETGALGFIAFVVLWISAFAQGWRAVRASEGMWRNIAAGLLGVLVALSLFNAFDDLFVHGIHAQVGIVLGMISTLTNWKAANGKSRNEIIG